MNKTLIQLKFPRSLNVSIASSALEYQYTMLECLISVDPQDSVDPSYFQISVDRQYPVDISAAGISVDPQDSVGFSIDPQSSVDINFSRSPKNFGDVKIYSSSKSKKKHCPRVD